MPKTIQKALIAVGVLLLALFGLAYSYFREEAAKSPVAVDRHVLDYPNIEVESEMGSHLPLSQIVLPNQGTLISFWATWCGPCLKEIPKILKSKISDHVKIVWINLDYGSSLDRQRSVAEWKNKNRFDLKTFFDGQGQLTEQLEITALPLNVLLDKNGRITWSNVGELGADDIKKLEETSAAL